MPPKPATAKPTTPKSAAPKKKVVLDIEPPSTLQVTAWNLIAALERHGTISLSMACIDALADLKRVSEYQPPSPPEA